MVLLLYFRSILIGSWLASILAGLVLNQAYRYFAMYPKDPISRKAIVVCSMLFCGAALIADYATVYLVRISVHLALPLWLRYFAAYISWAQVCG
jgi:hypothetical protein